MVFSVFLFFLVENIPFSIQDTGVIISFQKYHLYNLFVFPWKESHLLLINYSGKSLLNGPPDFFLLFDCDWPFTVAAFLISSQIWSLGRNCRQAMSQMLNIWFQSPWLTHPWRQILHVDWIWKKSGPPWERNLEQFSGWKLRRFCPLAMTSDFERSIFAYPICNLPLK